jgi:hypothetical protein
MSLKLEKSEALFKDASGFSLLVSSRFWIMMKRFILCLIIHSWHSNSPGLFGNSQVAQ